MRKYFLIRYFKIINDFDDIEKNRLGDLNANMISFSGCGLGIDYKGHIGVTTNRTSYGEYFNDDGELVIRENTTDRPNASKFLKDIK